MHIVELEETQLDDVVALANRMTDGIIAADGGSHSDELHRLFTGADLVWTVWQEKRAPFGIRTAIVKGLDVIKQTAASEYGRAVQVAAIRSRNAAEAHALCENYGDGRSAAA